ncbi:4182_t:CDS:2, partial [Rhizophagus irregularis]
AKVDGKRRDVNSDFGRSSLEIACFDLINEAKQFNLSIMRNQYFSGQEPALETGS